VEAGGGGGDSSDIFNSLFGGGGGGERGGRGGMRKGKDVLFKLKVTLADLYCGGSKKLRLSKSTLCEGCAGKGGAKVLPCRSCKGQGIKIIVRQIGPGMIQQMQAQCEDCDGQGEVINPKDRCKTCNGEKTVKTKKTLEVQIEKGMSQGSKIVFRQESDQAPNMIPGDVQVVLEQEDHPYFKRENAQLFYKKKITLVQSLTGVTFQLEHLDRRILSISTPEGQIIAPGSVKCIRDEGMPLQKNPTQTGNLYIEFEVEFPKASDLTPEIRQQLTKLLPVPSPEPNLTEGKEDSTVEEAFLESCNMEDEASRWKDEAKRHGEAYDEDNEEEGGHHHGATQCRAQ
jgi:DnaJ family protein A protein 2